MKNNILLWLRLKKDWFSDKASGHQPTLMDKSLKQPREEIIVNEVSGQKPVKEEGSLNQKLNEGIG